MVENVKPEVIKKTQDLLMPYFNKPPLTVKLLKKPPFRFLQDIILSVIKTTGFLNGVFTDEELNPDNVKNRNMKINFLNKLIYVVESTTGNHLSIKTSKIIAGLEPTKTNELLQLIGKAIQQQFYVHFLWERANYSITMMWLLLGGNVVDDVMGISNGFCIFLEGECGLLGSMLTLYRSARIINHVHQLAERIDHAHEGSMGMSLEQSTIPIRRV
ncbi:PREDICTED: TRAF3-interacting protein 1 [Ceratosolen solmsi marchali]|uniref:TRAF3-interacting protein 1 n=1 Tax=Ceratosolen solmsi marchali TaxID=326594 RepID=A0AAJ6YQL4_9HYME|nr:PREDICTED: TRAF3-interacting protein 1 [Ceratosolen solmsi marchali]